MPYGPFGNWYPKDEDKDENKDIYLDRFIKEQFSPIIPEKRHSYDDMMYRGIMDITNPLQHDLNVHQMRMNGFMGGAPGL
jgi:hypothetical protein